jgi:signal transduction histidine kinase
MSDVQFRVSSALKTIIGKELITDRHIAILELVKNSFDAGAARVDISFLNTEGDCPKIVIQDDGIGMSKKDIVDKWLFLAYSSKKDSEDYRNRQATGRVYAGAKGIGRFSCDRLGSHLRIYTRKESTESQIHQLDVDWADFETDQLKEFQTIPAQYRATQSNPYNIKKGTALEITRLDKQGWSREDLVDLRRKLERLVNPNQGNDTNHFRIFLDVPSEVSNDKKEPDKSKKVNGEIQNRIFESLGIKTTQIAVRISDDGETVTSVLTDRGVKIFEIDENNPYKALLRNINFHLFHLSSSAKSAFTTHMGIRIQEYGSVFLYKNGFRVHPFGDPGDDRLGIDARKAQGMFRRLGTRDIAGRIEKAGPNPGFKETSSRGDGLIDSPEYTALTQFFYAYVLKRLENYVVNFAKFGKTSDPDSEKGELPDISEIKNKDFQTWLHSWVRKLTGSAGVTRFEYDPKTIDILKSRSLESTKGIVENIERIAAVKNDPVLLKQATKARKHVHALLRAKQEAEIHAQTAESERDSANIGKGQVETEALLLKSILARDDAAQKGQHLILQETGIIVSHAEGLISSIRKSELQIPPRWLERLYQIIKSAKKAEALSRYSTHANYTSDSDELNADLVSYISQYVTNVLKNKTPEIEGRPSIPIHFKKQADHKFPTRFMPIRLMIVLDNLIFNAVKHDATRIKIEIIECTKTQLSIQVSNNGSNIEESNAKRIFEAGFTTTKGSGL